MPNPRRIAWVTGAGRGIGRACAIALAKQGHDVALTSRSRDELEATARLVQAAGAKAFTVAADVSRSTAAIKAHAAVVKAAGAPAILVNCAGIARSAPFLKTDEAFLDMHWRLNAVAPFLLSQSVLPAMVEAKWGRIVNIASIAAKVGHPYVSAYTMSKHAVLGLTRALAAEVATKGVTVNAVCPGYVDSQMTRENVDVITKKTGLSKEEALARIRAMNPQGRLVTPEEVAATVAHLCSDAAQGVTGQAWNIDGGAVQ